MQAVLEGVSKHSMFETECWERFFKPSLSGFDAAFVLRRTALPFPKHALFPSKRLYKRMRAQFENEMSVVDEDEEETLAQSIKLAKLPPKLLNKGPDKAREALLIGFDPTECFIKDAEDRVGGTALMFVDKYGGDVVGVAFKPNAVHADAALPDSLSWLPNPDPPAREDVIEEIATIAGADFVEKVLT
jgi:U3 small nucleolar RNA-associated protein 22